MHAGIHFIPAVLADYQRQLAHAAIEAGAGWPADSCKSMIVKAVIADRKIERVSYLPVWIDEREDEPRILTREDPKFAEIAAYVKEISLFQNLKVSFEITGNEVLVR